MNDLITGGCCCARIRYQAVNPKPVWYCHCEQCRRMTGHFMAAAQVELTDIVIEGEAKWYYVSARSRHGFCPDCGSQLFWRNDEHGYMSFTAGSVDNSSALTAAGHIFCVEKGKYYSIDEREPQFERWDAATFQPS